MNFRSSNNNNSRLQLNNNEVQIINMLNNMQIQNNRLIDQLITSNNDIRIMIQNILRQQQQTQEQTQNNRIQRARRNNFTNANAYANTNANANTSISTDNYSSLLLNLLFPEFSASSSLYTVDYVQPLETDNFTDPVPVYASRQQVENATLNILYRDIENPLNQSCPISLEPFHEYEDVIMIKQCRHIFKPLEIQNWFNSNVRCPVCRYDIREFPIASNNNNNEFHNYRRQRQNIIQERNTNHNNSQRVPFRILQRGETIVSNNNEHQNLNNLFTSVFRDTLITDLSNNLL